MPSLLVIESSPRGDYSISRSLTRTFVDSWKSAHTDGHVIERDLMKTELPFVDLPWIGGAYTPKEKQSPEMIKAIKVSDDLVAELQSADHIVLGTAMYNFAAPANVKAYIDHIVRVGVTVSPSYEGQLKGKKMTIILASGGVYTPGSHAESYNAESGYLKQIFGFIGITDLNIILAGGSGGINNGQISQEDLLKQFQPAVAEAAKA